MGAIRGAICAENSIEDISSKSLLLIKKIMEANSLIPEDISAVIFSCTRDLNACYPAKSVRENLNLPNVAFMCLTEMDVVNSLSNCIRVCVIVDNILQKDCKHCYIDKAAILRQDLS